MSSATASRAHPRPFQLATDEPA
jgi:hypothetical protein